MTHRKKKGSRGRWTLVSVIAGALLLAMLPVSTAFAEPAQEPRPVEATLEHLSDILQRLEGELAALRVTKAEQLEEQLEGVIELIASLLDSFDRPREAEEGTAIRVRIVRLDLMLHRLVYILNEIIEHAEASPAQPRARDAVNGLRRWLNAYVQGATAGMDPRESERFEKAAHELVRDMARRIADMAQRAGASDQSRPVLARLVERLEALLFRLDGFILQNILTPLR